MFCRGRINLLLLLDKPRDGVGEYSLLIRCIVMHACVIPGGMVLSSFGLKLGVVSKGKAMMDILRSQWVWKMPFFGMK